MASQKKIIYCDIAAVAQVQQPKQVVQPVAPQAEPERQKKSAADLVAFLTQHPGATTPEIVQGVWNRDYYKLKGTSLLMAPIQMMQRALKNRLITRDETKTPYKYYAAGTQTTAMQAQNQVAGKKTYEEYVKLIIKYLTKHPGAPVKDLFQFFPTQISAVPVVQKMLKVGLIVRDMSQKPAKWYVKGTQPSNVSTVVPPKVARKYKESDKGKIIDIIKNSLYSYLSREDDENERIQTSFRDGKFNVYVSTRDRGPRTDHGGPPDGDGWMTYDQIENAAKPYRQKYKPILEKLGKDLKTGGFKMTNSSVDYGEKGHISLDVTIG